MDFRSFSLAPNPFSARTLYKGGDMTEEALYSHPLTGHLDGKSPKVDKCQWQFFSPEKLKQHFNLSINNKQPQLNVPSFPKNMLSYVVGGFVGSKSQRNQEKVEPFPIGDVIFDILAQPQRAKKEKSMENTSQEISFVQNVVSNILLDISECLDENMRSGSCSNVMGTSPCDGLPAAAMRLLSECSTDSNDSEFIVFGTGDDCHLSDDEDDLLDDYIGDWEEDKLAEATEQWEEYYGSESSECKTPSKVRFDDNITVHVLRVWDFASRQARIGPWEEAGRDRVRFSQRIARTGEVLAPILSESHRRKVQSRMKDAR